MSFKQAKKAYKLNNPEKYIGDPTKLLYKSSWEENAFRVCDNNPNITKWGYETHPIRYYKPIAGGKGFKPTIYFPDLYIEYSDKEGNFIREIVEIKPHSQTRASVKRKTLTRLYENEVYMVNMAKWTAAKAWCESQGIRFSVMTEKSLFKPKRNK